MTKAQPKEMLPVVDKPVIQYVVEELILSGIRDILIITGRNKRSIEDHFDNPLSSLDIHFVRQKEQKGLGDAILHAELHCDDEPFAVLLGDTICISPPRTDPCTLQMMKMFELYPYSIVAIEQVADEKVKDYGIIDGTEITSGIYRINDIIEKPTLADAPSNLGAIGRYILTPDIFNHLRDLPAGVNGEIQLTDALRCQESIGMITACRRYDIGDKLGWMKSNFELTLENEMFGSDLRNFLSEFLNR
jgi:UTP--glucose-1-phosphate uridylyltransferase